MPPDISRDLVEGWWKQGRWYPVDGVMVLRTDQDWYIGRPLRLSQSGVLFTADLMPREGTEAALSLDIVGVQQIITARTRVIRIVHDVGAASFRTAPAGLSQCFELLAARQGGLGGRLRST